jgi:methionyl-tRNA formyltransferase
VTNAGFCNIGTINLSQLSILSARTRDNGFRCGLQLTPMSPRLVFMGSPDFALPSLEALIAAFDVVGVVTQPDRQAGRGRKPVVPSVKAAAEAHHIPVYQPVRIRAPEAVAQLRAWAPDLIVVAAFGQILSQEVLDLPEHGSLNVHASLLPRWRGASPIQQAILNGDTQTGLTIMKMDAGLDTGPILAQSVTAIAPGETGETLSDRLAAMGARLLVETVPGYLSGRIAPAAQPEGGVTYAPLLKKNDGLLTFDQTADELVRRVRAFDPWPGTFLPFDGGRLKVRRAEAISAAARPGKQMVFEGFPAVGTTGGTFVLREVQPEGKKPMSGDAFLLGARNWS